MTPEQIQDAANKFKDYLSENGVERVSVMVNFETSETERGRSYGLCACDESVKTNELMGRLLNFACHARGESVPVTTS